MEYYKIMDLDEYTKLIIPISSELPLSKVIDIFNSYNYSETNNAIIDMLVYVGNRDNRFQCCQVINGKINLNKFKHYEPSEDLIDKSYELFSHASIGAISRIFSPSIRRIVLEKRAKLNGSF